MYIGRNYALKEFLIWTRREIFFMLVVATIPTVLFAILGWPWIAIPSLPIALLGTAVAFVVGFKNNASYGRVWEARTAWGAIINASRAWGILAKDFVTNYNAIVPLPDERLREIHETLIYRHLAWVTALRFQLREHRDWESTGQVHNAEYREKYFLVSEWVIELEDELQKYLSAEELAYIRQKKNKAAQIINLQSKHLRELREAGLIDDLRHMQMAEMLVELYRQQGVCERIKNFPYPRQFATLNLFFVMVFIVILPFGLLQEFNKLGAAFVWMNIPFSVLLGWVFMSLEKAGEVTENPFEGGANDVPITSLARTIEIDLRDMLDEKEIPPPVSPQHNILM